MKKVFFLLPFLPLFLFFLAYFFMYQYISRPIMVPPITGLSLEQALPLLANHSLNVRIIQEKYDETLPPGIIVHQLPTAGQQARYHQTVLITLNSCLPHVETPAFKGKLLATIEAEAQKLSIRLKIYWLESTTPENYCIAQLPAPGTLRNQNEEIIIYCTQKKTSLVVMPSLLNHPIQEVFSFLNDKGIMPHIIEPSSSNYRGRDKKIIQQRPLPGTLIDLQKPINVQLLVD